MTCILVVEDEVLVRAVIINELNELGYEVRAAGDGVDAISKLPGVDVLLTDVRLPGEIDGWMIAAAARRDDPDIKVIYATGYAPDKPILVNGSVLFNKPYKVSAIVDVLTKWGCPPPSLQTIAL